MTGLILPMVAVVLIGDIPDDLFEHVDHGRTIAECGHEDRHLTPLESGVVAEPPQHRACTVPGAGRTPPLRFAFVVCYLTSPHRWITSGSLRGQRPPLSGGDNGWYVPG
jgi:hypothetical protein